LKRKFFDHLNITLSKNKSGEKFTRQVKDKLLVSEHLHQIHQHFGGVPIMHHVLSQSHILGNIDQYREGAPVYIHISKKLRNKS
jgi:hypothetical protein